MSGIFELVLKSDNKSGNSILKAFSDSGLDVEKGMVFMDRNYLYQVDIRGWIENGLDAEIMVPVSGNRVDKKYDVYIQSFLLPTDAVEADMENDTYNAHSMEPGITVYGSWENDEKVYHRWGNGDGFEPLIIKRNFNGVATDSIEVAEEFRLLFNLYFNSQKNEYVDVSDGEVLTVVKMNDNGYITIHKRYLKTYLAVKEKALIIHIDSRCVALDATKKVEEDGILRHDLDEVLEKCDVLTLHVPLTDSTRNLIDLEKMKKMKRSARILNLARGPVINQDDLYFALKNKIIKSAAIDVTSVEPIEKNSKLFELDNIVITPHIAWKSEKSMITLMNDVEKNLKLFIERKLEGLK